MLLWRRGAQHRMILQESKYESIAAVWDFLFLASSAPKSIANKQKPKIRIRGDGLLLWRRGAQTSQNARYIGVGLFKWLTAPATLIVMQGVGLQESRALKRDLLFIVRWLLGDRRWDNSPCESRGRSHEPLRKRHAAR